MVCNILGKEEEYIVVVGKQKGKMPLGKPRCRWEDNIKMVI
jgi:hypothetical protein